VDGALTVSKTTGVTIEPLTATLARERARVAGLPLMRQWVRHAILEQMKRDTLKAELAAHPVGFDLNETSSTQDET
jgi:hypothetical protein